MNTFIKELDADKAPLEVELQQIAHRYGFAPKITKIIKGDDVWEIYMEDIGEDTTLADIYGENPEDVPDRIWAKIRLMVQTLFEEEGIEYVDITPYNFLERNGKIYMIDFGDARYIPNDVEMDWFLQEFLDEHVNKWNPDFK